MLLLMENVNVTKNIPMANCRGCGKKVGCGCQLTNGLCAACVYKANSKPQTKFQVIKQAQELSNSTVEVKDNVVHINFNQ